MSTVTSFPDVPVEERIIQVLRHLGIEKAHFAAKVPRDWTGLAANYPEVVASLTLVCPRGIAPSIARPLESRLSVIVGDRGNQAQGVRQSLADLPGAEVVVLQDYLNVSWADAVADRGEEIVTALTDFLSRHTMGKGTSGLSPNEGEIAGVSYRIQGSGPPLFLLPMGLAPSQWDPVLDLLTQKFTTILVRGPHLGMIPQLESRLSGGYATLRRNLLDEIDLRPGETILDVGCGSGVHDRAIVRRTNGANAITAVDINRYLLGEARFLAEKEGINSTIEFRAGDAESLPFDDDTFDVTISITVIEEVDADKMLAEMVRVTKPGGRVGIVARSVDLPSIINLPLSPKLKAKLEAPGVGGGGVGNRGCADASLYHRFAVSGLVDVKMLPQLGASYRGAERRSSEENIMANLSADELVEWRAAVAKAESEGTFFIARPYHCAVGTIPE